MADYKTASRAKAAEDIKMEDIERGRAKEKQYQKKHGTSDGYMPRQSEVVKGAKKELYKMGKENVGKEKAVEGMKRAFKKHKE